MSEILPIEAGAEAGDAAPTKSKLSRWLVWLPVVVLLVTGIQGVNELWLRNRFVTKEDFDQFRKEDYGVFKQQYWERSRQLTETLTHIQIDTATIRQSTTDTKQSVDEVKADVRDLRKSGSPARP